jgi:5,6-dimethylbenzimidazole synthase
MSNENPSSAACFTPLEKEAVYKAIFARRDVRRFLSSSVASAVIKKILLAAHHAPSVGFMQPWNFIVIRDPQTKRLIKEAFLLARSQEAEQFSDERKKLYLSLKLEGIEEAPLNICVTCDSTRHGPAVLGRSLVPATDVLFNLLRYSESLAGRKSGRIGSGMGKHSLGRALEGDLAHPRSHRAGWLPLRGLPRAFRTQTGTRNSRMA